MVRIAGRNALCELVSCLVAWSLMLVECSNMGVAAEQVRRPVAAVAADRWLFVANERSGTISIVDWRSMRLVGEQSGVGRRLVDLAISDDSSVLVAVDRQQAELVFLRRRDEQLEVVRRLPTVPDPLQLIWHKGSDQAILLCCFSRQVVVYRVTQDGWQERQRWRLPFSPREAIAVGSDALVVSDAFGGRLAWCHLETGVRHVHQLSGHNLWGLTLAPSGDRVLCNMQRLNSFRPTSYEDIFWGGVMQNLLVELRVRDVQNPPGPEPIEETVYFVGRPSEGAGDPTDLLVTPDGYTIVALGGVHQAAARETPYAPFEYRTVGRRPIALCRPQGSDSVFVVCQMDDSIHELDLTSMQVTRHVRLTDNLSEDPVTLGESLFYDATLALDGWFSCHSCHTDGHSNGLLNDNFGDDSRGAPKRVPSLLGTATTAPWGWNGKMKSLEEQVRKSFTKTMQGGSPPDEVVDALVAYLRTLEPVSARTRAVTVDAEAVRRGETIFSNRGCADCHTPPDFTSPECYDVGIHDQVGNTHFNPPSLRGVGLRSAFFHDNRATDLREVFLKYGHPQNSRWSEPEVADLLAFLQSL